MSATLPVLPPPPFPNQFSSSSLPDLTASSPLAREVQWPDEESATPGSSRRDSGSASPYSSRQSSGQHRQKAAWQPALQTPSEAHVAFLEKRLLEAKRKQPPSRRSSSPSHLAQIAYVSDVDEPDNEREEDEFTEDESEDDSESDAERHLLPPSASASRRPSTDPPQPATGPNRIAFAPMVRIAAGIRSLAGSYRSSGYSRNHSRSTSPASSIYAPLLPPPGTAPGAALKQAAKYGSTATPAQIWQGTGDTPASSPYKKLSEAQRKRKARRRRKKKWKLFRLRIIAGLRQVFCCGFCTAEEEDGR